MNQPWIYMCSPSRSPLLPPSPSHPSGSFPEHQPWALVSCIQHGLVICFTLDSILVSMLFSQNIPSSPSPIESKSKFCISVSKRDDLLYTCYIQPQLRRELVHNITDSGQRTNRNHVVTSKVSLSKVVEGIRMAIDAPDPLRQVLDSRHAAQ